MPFPRGSVDKPLQYALCADVLAQTARNLGYEVNPETQASWHDTMWNLVEVDHMAEAAAGETADPQERPEVDETTGCAGAPCSRGGMCPGESRAACLWSR